MLERLKVLDPEYYEVVDRKNTKRVIHALEICAQSGGTYTSLRTGAAKQRPFRIIKVALNVDRATLFDRINRRVERKKRFCTKPHAPLPFPLVLDKV